MFVLTLRTRKACSVKYILAIMVCAVCVQEIGGQSHGDQDLIQRIKDHVSVTMSAYMYKGMNASLAIDGDYRSSPEMCNCCTVALQHNFVNWWKMDFGMMYPVKLIQFFGRNDVRNYNQFHGFKLSLSNESSTPGNVFYTNDKNIPGSEFDISVPNTIVRYITISKMTILTICEIKVFEGDCRSGSFGDECGKECHCDDNLPCNRTTGMCQHQGCKIGWQGGACGAECSNNTFGLNCSHQCHCKDNMECNKITGNCKDGRCAPGYDGLNCSIDCRTGNFGDECEEKCHCYNNLPCNRNTGMCQHPGCHIGWQGVACDIECSNTTFGPNCSHKCHCKDNTQCNMFTGNCTDGHCAPGYEGLNCSIDCRTGNFGDECGKECHCKDDLSCHRTTGMCLNQCCQTGWQGVACNKDCRTGSFGDECGKECHCDDNLTCNRITGLCQHQGCKIGWQGVACDAECPTHTYGVNCSKICGQCKNDSTCDPVTGACPLGCTEDYDGSVCKTKKEKISDIVIVAIVGGSGTVALFVIVIGVVITRCYLKKKNTRQEEAEPENNYTALNHLQSSQESTYAAIEVNKDDAEYVNINTTTEPRKTTSELLCGCVC